MIKAIEELKKQKMELKTKADKMGVVHKGSAGKDNKIGTKLALDYVKLCYSLEVTSEGPILKLILRGSITLMEDQNRIIFSGA